jgi:hypothetical protein
MLILSGQPTMQPFNHPITRRADRPIWIGRKKITAKAFGGDHRRFIGTFGNPKTIGNGSNRNPLTAALSLRKMDTHRVLIDWFDPCVTSTTHGNP